MNKQFSSKFCEGYFLIGESVSTNGKINEDANDFGEIVSIEEQTPEVQTLIVKIKRPTEPRLLVGMISGAVMYLYNPIETQEWFGRTDNQTVGV